jgi:hypothetical protein
MSAKGFFPLILFGAIALTLAPVPTVAHAQIRPPGPRPGGTPPAPRPPKPGPQPPKPKPSPKPSEPKLVTPKHR